MGEIILSQCPAKSVNLILPYAEPGCQCVTAEPDEIVQAAKYVPFLELIFGACYDVIPALVLTGASDLFEYVSVPGTDCVLPAVSGDMLFNVFNEYMGFLD